MVMSTEAQHLEMQIKSLESAIRKMTQSLYNQMSRNKIQPFFSKDLESSPRLMNHSDPNVKKTMMVLKSMEQKVNELYDLLDTLESE